MLVLNFSEKRTPNSYKDVLTKIVYVGSSFYVDGSSFVNTTVVDVRWPVIGREDVICPVIG